MYVNTAVQLTKDSPKEILELVAEIFGDIEELKSKLPETKTYSRREVIRKINNYYQSGNLVLVLGAGVSSDFGLPNWNTLLQKLMIGTIEKERKVSAVLSNLFTNIFSPSPLIAGRYLQRNYEDKMHSFEEEVRKNLYEGVDMERPSELMNEIVNFCIPSEGNSKIDSVISYNFDDIFEQRLLKTGIKIPFKPIFGIGINPNGNLPIYHVHGYLPQKGTLSENNQITFGESIYHKQYNDIYSWNNIVQINKYRDSNCLFIGSSLTDPNQRRLLDIAKKQKGTEEEYHFVFRERYQELIIKKKVEVFLRENSKILDQKSSASMELGETVRVLIEIIQKFEETDMASFGVKIIWINKWAEIPTYLRENRKFKK